MRRAILILVLLTLVGLGGLPTGCTEEASPSTITDDLGRQVNIQETPKRVVSLAPSITEILFALDLGDKLMGVTEACDYPDGAKEKPSVGPYYATNLEAILDKDPDVVFTDGHDPAGGQVEGQGIPLVVLQPTDFDGIFNGIELVARVMDVDKKGVEIVADLRGRLDAVTAKAAQAADRPSVFFEIDASDLVRPWTAGPGSFADTMITLAGGRNVVTGGSEWAQISVEELLSSDPDIIVLSDYPYVTPQDALKRQGGWQSLRAIKQGNVQAISDPSLTSRPGPRLIDGLEEMAGIIHPELFGG